MTLSRAAYGLLLVQATFLATGVLALVDPTNFEFGDILSLSPPNPGQGKWRMAARNESLRWLNNTIPYQYAPMAFSQQEVKGLKEAMDIYMSETCLIFRPATEQDPYSIIIRDGASGCNAILGQDGRKGAQTVNLAGGCRYYGLFLHELGHTIGLHHEHQHPDRDKGVTVNRDNAVESMRRWFDIISAEELNMYGVPYDVQSIMHYEESAFGDDDGKGGKKTTIVAKDPSQQRFLYHVWMKDLSFGDVKRINLMYKCNSHCGKVDCPANGFVNKKCQCETPQSFATRRCVNKYSDADCEKRKSDCTVESQYTLYEMFVNCRKTCKRCYEAPAK